MSELALVGRKVVFCQIGEGRYTIPADSVVRGVTAPRILPLPWLSGGLAGLIVVDSEVLPVIDLRAILGGDRAGEAPGQSFPRALASSSGAFDESDGTCELILVMVAGKSYAVAIDRVLGVTTSERVASEFSHEAVVRELDLAPLLEAMRVGREQSWDADGLVPVASLSRSVLPRLPKLAGVGLVVETETSTHLVALDGVLHTFDYLPRAAVPDPDPVFAGAALCRGAWIPVVRLDVLLGEKGHAHQEIGGYVVVEGAREPVAIAVKRIVGVSYDCDSSRFLCLTAHLDERLAPIADSERDVVPIASCDAADDDRRYLLFDLGSQPCAVDVALVENVLSHCAVVSTPPSSLVGLAGIAVVAGQALPVLDVAALLGLSQPISQPISSAAGYVVIACSRDERYVVPVSNVGRVVSIAETACARAPDDALISSIATIAAQTVWILSTEALVRRSGWNSHAA